MTVLFIECMKEPRQCCDSHGVAKVEARTHNTLYDSVIQSPCSEMVTLRPPTQERRPNQSEDWFALAMPIVEELQRAAAGGTVTSTQIIADAARSRGLTPRALSKQVLGAQFVMNTYPALVQGRQVIGGYSQVEYLAKIHQLDPRRADRLAGPVLAGEVSMAQMRNAFAEVVAATGGPSSNAAKAKQRGMAFEAACEHAIRQNGEIFGLVGGASLVPRQRLLDTTLDFAVVEGGRIKTAIEVKVGGLASARTGAFNLAASASLITRKVDVAYVLVPRSSEDLAEALVASFQAWGVDRARVAMVDEVPPFALIC